MILLQISPISKHQFNNNKSEHTETNGIFTGISYSSLQTV